MYVCMYVCIYVLIQQYRGRQGLAHSPQPTANSPSPQPEPEPVAPFIPASLPFSPCPSPCPPSRASSPCTSPPAKSLIFSMGRNPQYFHSEEILNIFNEEILNIVNRKKFSIFPMGRNPRYFQWEEILHIFNRKRGATHPKHTSHASFASPRHFSLHSHELLVVI